MNASPSGTRPSPPNASRVPLGGAQAPTPAAESADEVVDARVGLVRIGIALTVVQTAMYVGLVAVTTVLLPVQIVAAVGEGGKEAWLGIVTSVGSILSVVASPLFGRWSDRTQSRLGRRAPWLLAGAAVMAACYTLVGAVTQAVGLLVICSVQQVAFAAMTVAVTTTLPERVPQRRRGLMTGVTALATTGATLTAAFIGAAFVSSPFLGCALMGILVLVGAVAFVLLAPMGSSKGRVEPRTAPVEARPFAARVTEFFDAFRDTNFRWVWIGRAAMTLAYQLLLARLVFFSQAWFGLDLQAAATTTATVVATTGLAQVIALTLSGPISDKLGRKPFIYAGALFMAAGFLAACFTSSVGAFIAAYSVVSFGYGMFIGVDNALAADVLPGKEDVGRDLGLINLANLLPTTLAAAVGSIVLAMSGSYLAVLVAAAVLSVVGFVCALFLRGVR